MKKTLFFPLTLMVWAALVIASCTKKQVETIQGSMEADISGETHFSAPTANDVHAQNDGISKQFDVTGTMGKRVLSIALTNYDQSLGTFSFDNYRAIGGYNNGNQTQDDVIVHGTVEITGVSPGHWIRGNFSGTTNTGKQITNGSFSAVY